MDGASQPKANRFIGRCRKVRMCMCVYVCGCVRMCVGGEAGPSLTLS